MKEFINKLRNCCTEIEPDWNEHLEFWEGEEPGPYNEISVIVHYVIGRFAVNQKSDFEIIFEVVESGVRSKNNEISELAVVGFLEGILMVGSHKNISPRDFSCWLGSESKKAMDEHEQFFSSNT